ncbi:MAG: GNAT family N-acetyltransferase [Acidimicrobiia bacterium]
MSTRLVGPRVTLRSLEPADGDAWREIRVRNRDWLEPWEPLPEPGSPDLIRDPSAFRSRCASAARQRHLDAAHPLGIFLHDGTLIGEMNLSGIQRGPFQSAHVGYWVDQLHAGQGLVPEALVLMLGFAFESVGLRRVEVAVVPRNSASRRVVEKLGLREEGVSRDFLQIRGTWEDHVRFGITATEWSERRHELSDRFLGGMQVKRLV